MRRTVISAAALVSRALHSFPDCLLVAYQCTRTRSPYPPPWPLDLWLLARCLPVFFFFFNNVHRAPRRFTW